MRQLTLSPNSGAVGQLGTFGLRPWNRFQRCAIVKKGLVPKGADQLDYWFGER